MDKINFIYTITNLTFYTDEKFEILCSYLKLFQYDFIKLIYNDLVESNIKNIKFISNKYNINLIISLKKLENIKNIKNIIDYVEIFTPKKIKDIKHVILNISIKKLKRLKTKDYYFNIILNDIYNLKWIDVENMN